jgi:hypothetical protein
MLCLAPQASQKRLKLFVFMYQAPASWLLEELRKAPACRAGDNSMLSQAYICSLEKALRQGDPA